MDGEADNLAERCARIWPGPWRDGRIILILLTLALAIRGWAVWNTEVPARDSIGFIRQALDFQHRDWREVIKENHQHPGYPVLLLIVSWPIRALAGGVNPYSMQYAAQLTSALGGALLAIPMFFLGKRAYGRAVGFWGALLFQCLGNGPILSDAISDPVFLCLAASALAFGARALDAASPRPFAWCGLFTGLSYLVRPEGALVMLAVGVVLVGAQLVPRWRRRPSALVACAAALVGTALVAGSPYYLVTKCFTNKPSGQILTGPLEAEADEFEEPQAGAGRAGSPLFAVYLDRHTPRPRRIFLAGWAIGLEFARAYHYVGWLPVLLGLLWCRDRLRAGPAAWLLLAQFLLHLTLVWLVAVRVGYVSERHVLILVLCSVYQAAAVIVQGPFRLGDWLRGRAGRHSPAPSGAASARRPRWTLAGATALALLVAFAGTGLSKTVSPLHGHRAAHYAAGRWLAEHCRPADRVEDDHCWAHYYAGRVFCEWEPPRPPDGYTPVTYVVFSKIRERGSNTPHAYVESDLIARRAIVVYHWPENVPATRAQLIIYCLPQ